MQPCVLNFRDIRKGWFCKVSCKIKQRDVRYSARNFVKSSFFDVTNVQTQGCHYGVKWIKFILADKGIVEQGLEHLFITSSGSYVLNLEQFKLDLACCDSFCSGRLEAD